MQFQPKQYKVDAVQLIADIKYSVSGNDRWDSSYEKFIAHKGDWLVIANGEQFFMKDAEFKKAYEQANQYRERS